MQLFSKNSKLKHGYYSLYWANIPMKYMQVIVFIVYAFFRIYTVYKYW